MPIEMKEKIAWIRKKAGWFDPFIEAEDKWMEGIVRDELKLEKKYSIGLVFASFMNYLVNNHKFINLYSII